MLRLVKCFIFATTYLLFTMHFHQYIADVIATIMWYSLVLKCRDRLLGLLKKIKFLKKSTSIYSTICRALKYWINISTTINRLVWFWTTMAIFAAMCSLSIVSITNYIYECIYHIILHVNQLKWKQF